MTSKIQLLCLLVSFPYGIFTAIVVLINKRLLFNKRLFIKYLSTLIITIDLVLIYLLIIYKINKGIIHIYFFFSFLLGLITFIFKYKKIVKFYKKTCKR